MSGNNENKLGYLKTGLMYIGLLLSVIATFLGTIHFFKGQLVMAIIITLVLALGMFFLLDQLILKKALILKNSGFNKRLSLTLKSLYVLLALPLSFFTVHGINVELNVKNQVKNQYGEVRGEINEMNTAYNKQSTELVKFIEIDLQNLMTTGNKAKLKSKYNLDEQTLRSAKETEIRLSKKSAIENELKNNYQKVSNEHESFISKAVENISKWNLFELHNSMAIVDSQVPMLKKKIEKLYQTESTKYEFSSTISLPSKKREFELTNPWKLLVENSAYSLLLIAVLQHLLMLAPLFLTNKNGGYPEDISDYGTEVK